MYHDLIFFVLVKIIETDLKTVTLELTWTQQVIHSRLRQQKFSVLISNNVSKIHILKKDIMVDVGAHICQLKEIFMCTGTHLNIKSCFFVH